MLINSWFQTEVCFNSWSQICLKADFMVEMLMKLQQQQLAAILRNLGLYIWVAEVRK